MVEKRLRLKCRDVVMSKLVASEEEGVNNEVTEDEKDEGVTAMQKEEEKEVSLRVLKVLAKEMTMI